MARAGAAYALIVLVGAASPASATLTLWTGTQVGSHAGNLVVNGSFETGAPAPGFANTRYWATGTTNTPFGVPPGWSSSGASSTYATWGSDGPGLGLNNSAAIPDGSAGLYFGNLTATVSADPTFNADGSVNWSSAPSFSPIYGAPCTLTQTINTHLAPAPEYALNFWVSGENAAVTANWLQGVFGLLITNVLPGDPIQYLTVPSDTGALGTFYRFEFHFTPINPLLPVDITFINWGHLKWPSQSGFASELVLDDVMVNTIPAPAGALALASVLCAAVRRRR